MTPQDAHNLAARKARYAHQTWIAWGSNAARATPETIKAAMLATGTQGNFTGYMGTTGFKIGWGMALIWRNNARIGAL